MIVPFRARYPNLMRHKVILYNPPAVFWTMPLALLAVGSALDPERYEVIIVDGRLHSPERVRDHVDDALCLAITVLTGAPVGEAASLTRAARSRRADLPVVWGGWHPSLFPDACVREAGLTAAVIGQGEETLAEIVDRLAEGQPLDDVAGCCLEGAGGTVRTTVPRPMRDINDFPRHDYELIDVEAYFQRKQRRQLDYVTSQGCLFRCSFCADPTVYKRGWYGFAPERVVEEVTGLWRRYRFTDLGLQDETYFTYPKRVAAIAEGFLRDRAEFTWYGTLRADQGRRTDDEILALCRASGLRRVLIGLEAGAQQTLDDIAKDITVEDMWVTARKLVRHGIGATINVIVGFPGESEQSVDATLDMARELRAMSPLFEISFFYYQPYPGNPIAEKLCQGDYRLPQSLDEWSRFDFIGQSNEWLTQEQKCKIENFAFYQRLAFPSKPSLLRWPLHALARWRVGRDAYRLPWERFLVERLRPSPPLS